MLLIALCYSSCFLSQFVVLADTNYSKTQAADSDYSEPKDVDGDKHDPWQNLHSLSTFNVLTVLEKYLPDNDVQHTANLLNTRKGATGLKSFQNVAGLGQTGTKNTSVCENDTDLLIKSLLNEENWALQFFDACGKPGPSLTQGWLNFVGNYDQCKSSSSSPSGDDTSRGFYGGYFLFSVTYPAIPIPIQIGVCLPDTCSEREAKSVGTRLIQAANASATIDTVHHLDNETEVTSATIVAIVVVSVIGILMIAGTVFDIAFVQFPLWYERRMKERNELASLFTSKEQNRNQNGGDVFVSHHNRVSDNLESSRLLPSATTTTTTTTSPINRGSDSDTTLTKVLMAFSVYSNGKKILSVSKPPESLHSIHGIRFFSMSWVILGHVYLFSKPYAVNTTAALPKFYQRGTFDVISNGFLSVDTFFTLSGLLVSYLTIGQLMTKGSKFNWPMFYFHRFWRLTPPYMLVLLLYLGFQQYFIRGPLRNFEQPKDKTACEDNWWTNLLYINNLVYWDRTELCFGHSWYLANDMQFFILSPLMMVPFYFHRVAGLCSCLVLLLASWITTAVSSNLEDWPLVVFSLKPATSTDYFFHYYITPWCRIGPFIVGIVAGYVLAILKGRKVYMKWWVVGLGWGAATASALAVLYGIHDDIEGNDASSRDVSALYNSVSRSVWGVCVSWVIIACKTGYGGPVNVLLSWSPFAVLGRLSYMMYLIHPAVVGVFLQNLDYLIYMNDTTMVVIFLGILVATNLLAFVLMLGLESPMIGLEKALLKREKI